MYRHHIDKLSRTRLDDILVEEGMIERDAMNVVHAEMDQTGKIVSDVLIGGGFDEWELAKLQVSHYGLPFIDATLHALRPEVLELLPADFCTKNGILPLERFGSHITIACWEVPSPELLHEIAERSGCSPFVYVSVKRMILEALEAEAKKPQRGAQRPAAAKLAPGQAAPGAAAKGTPEVSRAAPSAPPPAEPELPPLDLPTISMKLNASAQAVSSPRRSVVGRTPATSVDSSFAGNVAGSLHGTVFGNPRGAAGESRAPEPARPAAAAQAPAPQPAQSPSPPASPASHPSPAAPPTSRPLVRSAPVLPGRSAAKAPAAPEGGWESIFDMGETAVKKSVTGEVSRRGSDPGRSRG